MFISVEDDRFAFPLWDWHRDDLILESAFIYGLAGFLLTVKGEGILILTCYFTAGYVSRSAQIKDVFGRFTHRLQGKNLLHLGIGVSPA